MDTFRVMHVSDFHIATRPRVLGFPDFLHGGNFPAGTIGVLSASSYDPQLADLVARQVYLRAANLDLILVTGDEATTGDDGDLRLAFLYFNDPALPGGWWSASDHPSFRQPAGPPIVLIPGNHDRFDGVFKNAGGTAFDKTFHDYWDGGRKVQSLAVLQGNNGEKLAIVSADFTLARNGDAQGLGGHFGQGYVYANVLQDLLDETQQLRGKHGKVGIVWAVHFPPFFPHIDSVLKLINEQLLTAAAAQANVQQILCGHTHTPAEYPADVNGVSVNVCCAGTATQYYAPSPNTIHLRDIDVQNGVVVSINSTTLTWDQEAKDFK